VLVNNAAVEGGDDILRMDEASWDRDLTVCLKSVFLCSKEVLPGMIARRSGVIVNIASVNALAYFANEGYSAAKAGMLSLTRSIAARYGRDGIRCVAIAPGTIRTPIWAEREQKAADVFDRLTKWYPLGRVGEPEDVAATALFLASDDAAWITGTVVQVDGGLLAGNAQMARELVADYDDDVRALGGKPKRHHAPDPGPAPRDDDRAARETHVVHAINPCPPTRRRVNTDSVAPPEVARAAGARRVAASTGSARARPHRNVKCRKGGNMGGNRRFPPMGAKR